jgi:ABC-2 type transport system permease protein
MFARNADTFVFASALHGFTFMFASLTLASSAGTMLFMKEEAEILLHRPVTPQQMLRAKCAVLAGFALMLALALNLAGFVAGLGCKGATWRFIPAHLFSTALLMLFSAASIVLVYNACLKWFGRERLDNLLASAPVAPHHRHDPQRPDHAAHAEAGQLSASRKRQRLAARAAADVVRCARRPDRRHHLESHLALAASRARRRSSLPSQAGSPLEKLGNAYGQGLMNLNESEGTAKDSSKPRGRWLAAIVKLPPLRWWLRDPVERQSFMLTSAYLVRDREIKLRLYPGVAPMLIMPLIMLFPAGGRGAAVRRPR